MTEKVAIFVDVGGELLVGTDIESISAVAQSLVEFGSRYARRVYTDLELTTCGGISPAAAPRLAARSKFGRPPTERRASTSAATRPNSRPSAELAQLP
jgi:hypothetical protein